MHTIKKTTDNSSPPVATYSVYFDQGGGSAELHMFDCNDLFTALILTQTLNGGAVFVDDPRFLALMQNVREVFQ